MGIYVYILGMNVCSVLLPDLSFSFKDAREGAGKPQYMNGRRLVYSTYT